MQKIGVFILCNIIVLIGYKLFGFEMVTINLLTIISFNSCFIDKGDEWS